MLRNMGQIHCFIPFFFYPAMSGRYFLVIMYAFTAHTRPAASIADIRSQIPCCIGHSILMYCQHPEFIIVMMKVIVKLFRRNYGALNY